MGIERKQTILLVEDEAVLAMAQKMVLQKYGYEVLTAPSGEKAIAAVKDAEGIDLILMDIDLGKGMDGTEAAQAILQDRDIPVVFCSSHTEPEIVSKTEKITSYGYVVKGSSATVLDASIKMAFKLFQAKGQIVASQKLQHAMVANIGDVVVIIDRTGIIRYESPNIFPLFGWRPEARFGRDTTENVHPDDLETVRQFTDKIASEPNAKGTIELRFKCGDGQFVWIELTVVNLLADPDIQGLLGNFHDISKRKQAEKDLLTSKRLLEQTFEQSPVPMALVSMPDGILRFINPATRRFLGIEDEASRIGLPLQDMPVTWKDLDLQGNPGALEDLPLVRSLAGIKTDGDERCIIRKDGTIRYELVSAAPIYDAEGTIIAGYLTMMDITGRQLAEQALQTKNEEYAALNEELMSSLEELQATSEEIQAQNEELMQADHRLRTSEERYRLLLANLETGVVVYAMDGSLLTINARAAKLFGLPDDHISGKSAFDPAWIFVDEDEAPLPLSEYPVKRVLSTKAPFMGRILGIQSPGGSKIIWVSVNGGPLMDTTGKIHEILISFVDITERKQAEDALRVSEEKFKYIFDNSILGKSLTLPSGELQANQALCDLLGYSPAEFGKLKWQDITHPDDLDLTQREIDRLMSGAQDSTRFNKRFIHKDGTVVWVDLFSSIRRDKHGHGLYLMSSVVDITQRRRMEEELRRSDAELRKAQELAHIGSWSWDPQSGTVTGSEELYRIFGLSQTTLRGPLFEAIAQTIHPEDRHLFPASATGPFENASFEFRILAADGSAHTIWIKSDGAGFGGPAPSQHRSGIAQDITERKMAEAAIQRQLSEKNMLLREVHHRIKNNIASIEGILSMQMQSLANPEAVFALQDSISRVSSIRVLYDKLMASEEFKDIPVRNYLETIVDLAIGLFPSHRSITCDRRIDDFSLAPDIMFPLGIICNELVTNIMKYAFTGRESGRILISLTRSGRQLTFLVQDDGVGFAPGFSLETSKSFGILLVTMLSEQLRGTFTIENRQGTRSVLRFDLQAP